MLHAGAPQVDCSHKFLERVTTLSDCSYPRMCAKYKWWWWWWWWWRFSHTLTLIEDTCATGPALITAKLKVGRLVHSPLPAQCLSGEVGPDLTLNWMVIWTIMKQLWWKRLNAVFSISLSKDQRKWFYSWAKIWTSLFLSKLKYENPTIQWFIGPNSKKFFLMFNWILALVTLHKSVYNYYFVGNTLR
jgi:hypothetical protein